MVEMFFYIGMEPMKLITLYDPHYLHHFENRRKILFITHVEGFFYGIDYIFYHSTVIIYEFYHPFFHTFYYHVFNFHTFY